MTIRNYLNLAVCAFLVGQTVGVSAQGAPFTIRRPPDGSTVKEKVRIEIPRRSIGPGGFVAFYLDDKFSVAVAPDEEKVKGVQKPFIFVWDTKRTGVSEGEHTVKAILYQPVGSAEGATAVAEKATSEVKLIVANKIKGNLPASFNPLRYQYREGEILEYNRESKSTIVGSESAVSGAGGTGDQELDSVKSTLILGIEDFRAAESVALVRNKLTSLQILANGQETVLPASQLSGSMYQELNPQGRVLYETGTINGLLEFTAQGLNVNSTLELPLLPAEGLQVGKVWTTKFERIDIPGLPVALQPRTSLENKFNGLEWEGGRQTAKITQTSVTDITLPSLPYGGMTITAPKIAYKRELYIAYQSGTLVKSIRTLTITGRTADGAAPSMGGGGGAAPGGMGGMMAPPGGRGGRGGGLGSGGGGGGMSGMMGMGSIPGGMMGGPPGGRGGAASGGGGGRGGRGGGLGSGGGGGGRGGGMMAPPGGRGGLGSGGGGRQRGGGDDEGSGSKGGNRFGRQNNGFGGGNAGGGSPEDADRPITIKAVTDTELLGVKTR